MCYWIHFYLGLFPWSTVASLLATNIGYVLSYQLDTAAGNITLLMSYRLVLCTGAMCICHETCPVCHFQAFTFLESDSLFSSHPHHPIRVECSAVGYWWAVLTWCNSKSESYFSRKLRDALLKMVACADTCDSAVLLQPIKPNWIIYSMHLKPSKSHHYGKCVLNIFWLKLKYQNSARWDTHKSYRSKDEISKYLKT